MLSRMRQHHLSIPSVLVRAAAARLLMLKPVRAWVVPHRPRRECTTSQWKYSRCGAECEDGRNAHSKIHTDFRTFVPQSFESSVKLPHEVEGRGWKGTAGDHKRPPPAAPPPPPPPMGWWR